jgi:hypothetical protein
MLRSRYMKPTVRSHKLGDFLRGMRKSTKSPNQKKYVQSRILTWGFHNRKRKCCPLLHHLLLLLLLLLWLYSPLLGLGCFFSSLTFYTVGRTPWTGDQSIARPLPTHRAIQIQNKRTETSMPWVGFEPTIRVFERAKTVHALYRSATVIGLLHHCVLYISVKFCIGISN